MASARGGASSADEASSDEMDGWMRQEEVSKPRSTAAAVAAAAAVAENRSSAHSVEKAWCSRVSTVRVPGGREAILEAHGPALAAPPVAPLPPPHRTEIRC
eukprot:366130-Chlamydomonas_euryale.AAC.4